MSTLSKIGNFLHKHRNKLLITGLTFGGAVLLTRYARKTLKQCMEKEAQEFVNRSRKQHHFENITRTCNQTIKSLYIVLNEAIAKSLNTEEIVEALKSEPKSKLELWNDLKIQVFSRLACLVYLSTMLVITLRLQLSIVGGYLYNNLDSIPSEMQEKYLSLSQNLLKDGVLRLTNMMKTVCQKVLEPVSLRKQLRLSDIEALFWSIQTLIEENVDSPIQNFRQYILYENISESHELYNNILQLTADFLESDELKSVTAHCVNRGFILLIDQLSEYYTDKDTKIKEVFNTEKSNSFVNPYSTNLKPLAKLLPIMNGLFNQKSFPDMLIQSLITNEKVQNLGANVYECLL